MRATPKEMRKVVILAITALKQVILSTEGVQKYRITCLILSTRPQVDGNACPLGPRCHLALISCSAGNAHGIPLITAVLYETKKV
jgi:hypothetical protein